MSGIVLEFRRDGAPAKTPVVENMLDRLEHRGRNGRRVVVDDHVALGCQLFSTTPEDETERQPVVKGARLLAFDGRLDNREDLLRSLDRWDPDGRSLSDAKVVLEAFEAWGNGCFDHLLGPFAVVLWDGSTSSVVAARDGLGDRTLFYSLDPKRLAVASEEFALLAHPEVSDRLNERRIAHHFAICVPDDSATFFADVTELRPGEVLTVTTSIHRSRLCWDPRPEPGVEQLSDGDCVDRYTELLSEAIRCCLRSTTPPAVLMSGGLDSTSIAAFGARERVAAGEEFPMRAVSWIFDELQECDERRFMDAVITRCGIKTWRLLGDDAWPMASSEAVSRNPGTPEQNPYRELKQRAFRCAAAAGSGVVLSGASADLFYTGTEAWFWDLLCSGRWLEAGSSLLSDVRGRGPRDALRRAGFGAPFRPIRSRLTRQPIPWPWLTDYARNHLDPGDASTKWRDVFPHPAQSSLVLGAREARSVSLEAFDGNRAGVDIRYPYRDRRLTEFMLSLPAHQLYRHGRFKHLARVAGSSVLPPEILDRVEPTLLTPLFRRGIFEREVATVHRLLYSTNAVWPRFVDPRWVEEILGSGPKRPLDEILLWHCVGFESWVQRHGWMADTRHGVGGSVSLQESAA